MNKGILIFAQNSEYIDYSLLALISGGLAAKHLKVPVSLATDAHTIKWMKTSRIYKKAEKLFDSIIEIDDDTSGNKRKLKDGVASNVVPFKNSSRSLAWNITPYERTLLIDSDFLIFSDTLNNFWEVDHDIMISKSMLDLAQKDRTGYHDIYISDTGIHLCWATTVMFTKNQQTKTFFDTVEFIKKNYANFSEIYRFDSRIYRNDIAFSLAKHILDGFSTNLHGCLPPIPTVYDSDILQNIDNDSRLLFLISQNGNFYSPMSVCGMDIHIMNKQSIVRNKEAFLKLI